MTVRIIASALLASAIAFASVGISAQPAEAGWVSGWFTFGGRATTMTRTFWDGSPARTPVVLFLQKKAGGRKCRAQLIVRSGNYISRSRIVSKYTRTRTRAYASVIHWPNWVHRTTVMVKTNGRCVWRAYAK